jgi:hypothetical protein
MQTHREVRRGCTVDVHFTPYWKRLLAILPLLGAGAEHQAKQDQPQNTEELHIHEVTPVSKP